ncbi:MAG: WG repeat-containing protein, partial [Firmicutes bacterium]|nr:WG repeat-containing protein [Bacillota bacterium]
LGDIKGNGLLELNIHPEGYFVKQNPNDSEHVQDLYGESLTWFQYGSSLVLTEVPGYAIETVTNRVLAIRQGEDITVYEPEEEERVMGQKGDYWIIEKSLPWPGNNLTVFYLRDMDFQIAMDGMLFDSIYDIDGDYIACTVITSGTYYRPPEEVVEVDWCVMTTDGNRVYPQNSAADSILLSADEGYCVFMEDHEHRKMYFYDGSAPLELEEGTMPMGPCIDGLISFKTDDGKYGVINKDGEIVVQPLFDSMSKLHQNMAVVVYGNDFGVIRLEGGTQS